MTPDWMSVDHAIRRHFGVDPEVLVVAQQPEHRLGNAADPGLDGGPVGNQRRDVARDRLLHLGDLRASDIPRADARFRRTRRRG